jgi:phospholipase/carboxylesterase
MLINGKFKNRYLINQKENENLEFIPIDIHGNKINYNSCLIWLYDGDHIEYFADHLLEFNNFPPQNFKIQFVRAPFNPITFDSFVLQRSWFNIFDLPDASGRRDLNKKEIDEYNKNIHREIKDQYNIIGDYKKIFIGGFSQSGCMALYSTLTYGNNIGGCISLAGFNFDFSPLDSEKKSIPLLCINGQKDEVIIQRHAKNSFSNLNKLGFNINNIIEPGLYHFFSKSGLTKANTLLELGKFE